MILLWQIIWGLLTCSGMLEGLLGWLTCDHGTTETDCQKTGTLQSWPSWSPEHAEAGGSSRQTVQSATWEARASLRPPAAQRSWAVDPQPAQHPSPCLAREAPLPVCSAAAAASDAPDPQCSMCNTAQHDLSQLPLAEATCITSASLSSSTWQTHLPLCPTPPTPWPRICPHPHAQLEGRMSRPACCWPSCRQPLPGTSRPTFYSVQH